MHLMHAELPVELISLYFIMNVVYECCVLDVVRMRKAVMDTWLCILVKLKLIFPLKHCSLTMS